MIARNARPETRRTAARRKISAAARRRWIVAIAAVVFAGLGTAGGWWSWHTGKVQAAATRAYWSMVSLSSGMGFTVQGVLVTGRFETPRDDLMRAIRLVRGAPILVFDPEAAKARIEALPWVRAAHVQRRLPGTVFVQVEERRALAVWQHDNRFALIDTDGAVIQRDGLERFTDLPLVVGEDAPDHAAELLRFLWTEPDLMRRVRAAVRVGGRRWNVVLDNGIDIHLPEDDPAAAWSRLAGYEKSHGVLADGVGVLDLRVPGRLIVREKPQAQVKHLTRHET